MVAAALAGIAPLAPAAAQGILHGTPQAADASLPTVLVEADDGRGTDTPGLLGNGAGVGRSVVSLGGETVRDTKAAVVSDIARALPGMSAIDSTSRQTSLFVRGQGVTSLNDGLTGSVGLFVDGFYLGRPSYAGFGLFDLEEATLQRGASDAQGGPGSIAGELRLKTQAPTATPRAEISTSMGSRGYRRATGFINGPLDGIFDGNSTDDSTGAAAAKSRWQGRLSFDRQIRDGMLHNVFDDTEINDQDRLGLRGQLAFAPHARLNFRLAADYGVLDQRCCTFPLLGPGSPATQARDAYMGYERVGGDPQSRMVDTDSPGRGRLAQRAISLTSQWQASPEERWVSLTGVRTLRYDKNLNDDASSLRLISGSLPTRSYQITQETRWERETEEVQRVAGLFLMHERIQGSEQAFFQDEVFPWVFGGLLREQVPFATRQNSGVVLDALVPPRTFDGLRLDGPYAQTSNTASLLGSSAWQIGERNRLGAGLRGTVVDRRASISRMRSGGDPSASLIATEELVDSLVGENFDRRDRRRDWGLSGRLGVERALGMAAGAGPAAGQNPLRASLSIAQGYKAGGLNLVGLTGIAQPEFQQETSLGVEAGLRGSVVFQGRRRGDFAVQLYRTRIRNYQALTYTTGEGLVSTPRQNNIINIPRATLTGLEAETQLSLPRRLSLGLGLAYSRAISDDFPNAPNAETLRSDRDLSGEQLYNAPVWSARASLGQALPWEDRIAYWGLDYTHRSSYNLTVEKNPNTRVRAHGLTDLRVGLRKPSSLWSVEGWVKNLTDEEYLSSAVALYGLGDYGGLAGDPRMIGITLTVGMTP